MKFFRGLFGGGKSEPVAKPTGATPQYVDVLSKPGKNAAKGTAEVAAEAARKSQQRRAESAPAESLTGGTAPAGASGEKSTMSMIRDINAQLEPGEVPAAPEAEAAPTSGKGIWDMEEAGAAAQADAPAPAAEAPSAPRASARQRRTKTRLIGFDKSDGSSVDALNPTGAAAPASIEPAPKVTFPVGWVLVVKGPGRGESFPLVNGLSSVGRGVDQTVRLDFGDGAISRSGHAAIAYDNDKKTFMLGHGNKANIVRLNDTPVISSEELSNGDHIRIGETTLRVVTLCGADFAWTDYDEDEGDDDVAIA